MTYTDEKHRYLKQRYLTELTELIATPKTLRSMKNTNWAKHSSREVYAGYKNCLRIKAKNNAELTAIMNKWTAWAKQGKLENIYNNADGDIIFCEKWDIYDHFNNTIKADTRNAERGARERVEGLEQKILLEKEKIKKPPVFYTKEREAQAIENKKLEDAQSEARILKCEKELPNAIEEYDRKNALLAVELGYAVIPYANAVGIERSSRGDFVMGQKQFEKDIKKELRTTLKDGEECYNEIAWKHRTSDYYKRSNDKIWYSFMPNDKEYYFENGDCFIKIHYNLTIQQQVYFKKGHALQVKGTPTVIKIANGADEVKPCLTGIELNSTLFYAEMFSVIKKRMKSWNTQNTTDADRFIEHKNIQGAFMPYEECGVECFYVRLGYATDGKKLPNHNRGTLECLKSAWRENIGEATSKADKAKAKKDGKAIKMPTKKDDLIKELMKL